MNQPRVGLVGVTCKYESGGQRAEELLAGIKGAFDGSSHAGSQTLLALSL